jgi:hypothetical protein
LCGSAFNQQASAGFLFSWLGDKFEPRYGRDRRKRFTPKAERPNRKQVLGLSELRRGMASQGQFNFSRGYTLAIIGHFNELLAAFFNDNINAISRGV